MSFSPEEFGFQKLKRQNETDVELVDSILVASMAFSHLRRRSIFEQLTEQGLRIEAEREAAEVKASGGSHDLADHDDDGAVQHDPLRRSGTFFGE